ncbi:hypothetical protein [Kaistia sp. UC242_56]|uniref:hypothetical protein n=1 Tax=Kaistia sp. UC242_56 TaxID=3374625 RepID=UPI0037A35176
MADRPRCGSPFALTKMASGSQKPAMMSTSIELKRWSSYGTIPSGLRESSGFAVIEAILL